MTMYRDKPLEERVTDIENRLETDSEIFRTHTAQIDKLQKGLRHGRITDWLWALFAIASVACVVIFVTMGLHSCAAEYEEQQQQLKRACERLCQHDGGVFLETYYSQTAEARRCVCAWNGTPVRFEDWHRVER